MEYLVHMFESMWHALHSKCYHQMWYVLLGWASYIMLKDHCFGNLIWKLNSVKWSGIHTWKLDFMKKCHVAVEQHIATCYWAIPYQPGVQNNVNCQHASYWTFHIEWLKCVSWPVDTIFSKITCNLNIR
jgi:hypothetical protein